MSNMVFYIKLEGYLHQWLTHSLGNPVVFPRGSNENAVIRRFLSKLPPNKQPDIYQDGYTAIEIPYSKAKPPRTYNYLGPRAKFAIKQVIEDLFRQNLWFEMSDVAMSGGLNKNIMAWCEMHGIDDNYSEAVRQKYYRMRKTYNSKGIFLAQKHKKMRDK